jgi:hypothetical protein
MSYPLSRCQYTVCPFWIVFRKWFHFLAFMHCTWVELLTQVFPGSGEKAGTGTNRELHSHPYL